MNWSETRLPILSIASILLFLIVSRGRQENRKAVGIFGMNRQTALTLAVVWVLFLSYPTAERILPGILWIWALADLFALALLGVRIRRLGRPILRVPITASAKFLTILGYGVIIPAGLLSLALRPGFPIYPVMGVALTLALRLFIELRGMTVHEYGVRVYRHGFFWAFIRRLDWDLNRDLLVIHVTPNIWNGEGVEISILPEFRDAALETMGRLSETVERVWILPNPPEANRGKESI